MAFFDQYLHIAYRLRLLLNKNRNYEQMGPLSVNYLVTEQKYCSRPHAVTYAKQVVISRRQCEIKKYTPMGSHALSIRLAMTLSDFTICIFIGHTLSIQEAQLSQRVGGHYDVQGHLRSLILIPIESSYATSY